MAPLASMLVVTWNARALLERCLTALAAQTLSDREIVVVDNGSTDGSADLVAVRFPAATLVRARRNLHFAAGNNLGIAACRGRYVSLLNNDCVPEPTWLERAVAAAEATGAGMVATRQLKAERPDLIDSGGIALDRAAIAWDRLGGLPADAPDGGAGTSNSLAVGGRGPATPSGGGAGTAPLFGPSGGAGLYSRVLLDDVGLFDAELTAYYEDVDLAWRARLRGWRCAEAAGARAVHLGSATLGRNGAQKRFLLGRNKLWVALRNYPGPDLRRYLGAVLAYDLLALAAYLAATSSEAVPLAARRAALAGRVAALQGLPRQLLRRRVVQRRRTAPPEEVLAAMAPLEPPWRLRARFAHLPEAV